MPSSFEFASYLNRTLKTDMFRDDVSNNGLQFDAGREIRTVLFGVDACLPLFRKAAELHADMVVVHHGISWGGGLKRIDSVMSERLITLSGARCSLYAAHLPMDSHPELGHNAELSRMLGIRDRKPFGVYHGYTIGFSGDLPHPMKAAEIAALYDGILDHSHASIVFPDPEKTIRRVGIISGGGAWSDVFLEMTAAGIDCLVTGALTHESASYVLETDSTVVVLGHYRSECPGLHALMKKISCEFPEISCHFAAFPTGM